jgi:hypothetical protein
MIRLRGNRRQLSPHTSIVRVLPQVARRHVGPFVFLDHFGPATIGADGMDVRPHPHIGLATVTVLYDGAVRHRDSVGSDQWIRPGAVNWMTAGRGIVHSERSEDYRGPMHGLQLWVALPDAHQEVEPSFHHHPAETIPRLEGPGHTVEIYVGTWADATSPVATYGPTLLALVELQDGATVELPAMPGGQELGVLVVQGEARLLGETLTADELLVLGQGGGSVRARGRTRLAVLGGEPVGPRTMAWNFVHSDPASIEQAKQDWQEERFPLVPGDADERIPLP